MIASSEENDVSEAQAIKEHIEGGASCIEAYENANLQALRDEGNGHIADMIQQVLQLVTAINYRIGVE